MTPLLTFIFVGLLTAGIGKQIDMESCQHRPTHDATHRQICLTCASETALQRHLLESRKKAAAEQQVASSSCATESRVTFALNGNGMSNGNGIHIGAGMSNGNGISNGNGVSHDTAMSNGVTVHMDLSNGKLNGLSNGTSNGFSNGEAYFQIPHCDPETGWLAP